MNPAVTNFAEYSKPFDKLIKARLEQVRQTIKKAAPGAEEIISYSMPAFKYHGRLVYFAAFKNHIGFYPMAIGVEKFKHELDDYKWAKGSIQFPHDKPLPLTLITRIVKFRVQDNLEKESRKKKK